jgi:hypothetical protein
VFGARTRRAKEGDEFSREEKHDANHARFVASLPWDEDPTPALWSGPVAVGGLWLSSLNFQLRF